MIPTAPGIYPGVSMADYLALPCFSAGVIKRIINECPAAAWHESWLSGKAPTEDDAEAGDDAAAESDDTDASDAGSVAHAILLEDSTDGVAVIDPRDHPADKTGNIPKGWTNKSIKAARDEARAAGKIPMLLSTMHTVNAMVDSGRCFIESLRNTEPAIWAAFQPGGGDSELTCLWDDGGTLCRMRPDRISKDRRVIIDPKFSKRAASPAAWSRAQIGPMGYRISAGMYRRGAEVLFGTLPDYIFLVIPQQPPHLPFLVGMDPPNLALGHSQVEYGMNVWRACIESGEFPAHPPRVCYPDLPAWEAAQWADQTGIDLDAMMIPADISKLFKMKEPAHG